MDVYKSARQIIYKKNVDAYHSYFPVTILFSGKYKIIYSNDIQETLSLC